ncbi:MULTISPECIES: hypothetical protein [unclassified Novosphingobium]|jgi:hypothetical protein|nr:MULTISPECIES: hypothetical protein [unclassified Novosphingobium]QOV95188.1 hypothetical protein IM701_07135 [Novosphingobium sp. ES2-1]
MEFEIEEPVNPLPWEAEWRCKTVKPGHAVDRDDMSVKALEIPESEES